MSRRTSAGTVVSLCFLLAGVATGQPDPCIIDTVAGGGVDSVADGDGGPATEAKLRRPGRIEQGADGSIYFYDSSQDRIRRVGLDSMISTVYAGDIDDFAVDGDGVLLVAKGNGVDKIRPGAEPIRWVGSEFNDGGASCPSLSCPVGMPATAINLPSGVDSIDIDSQGNLFAVVPLSSGSRKLLVIGPDGTLLQDAGWVLAKRVFVDANDQAHVIERDWRTFTADGATVSNEDRAPFVTTASPFAVGPSGDAYFLNSLSGARRIARLTPDLVYDHVAGDGETGFFGDGGPAYQAKISSVGDLLLTPDDTLYFSDRLNSRVRKITRVSECPTAGPRPLLPFAGFTGSGSPGGLINIYGIRLGPPDLVVAEFDSGGLLPTELAGTRVLHSGTPLPLLFVSEGQLAAMIPFGATLTHELDERGLSSPIGGVASTIEIETPAGGFEYVPGIGVYPVALQLFTVDSSPDGPIAALNQDGSLNTSANPARPDEIVTFWGNGFGPLSPTPLDGALVTRDLPQPEMPITVSIDGQLAEILYAGGAPGMVAGIIQLNVRIPTGLTRFGDLRVAVTAGTARLGQRPTLFIDE